MPRRSFLRGCGIALSLPMLDAMTAAFAAPVPETKNKSRRMLGICNNLGLLPDQFFPTSAGRSYKASPYLEILRKHSDDLTVFSGVPIRMWTVATPPTSVS